MKTVFIVIGLLAACSSAGGAKQNPIVIENTHMRYTISPEGRNLAFIDRASGIDYLRGDKPSTCALIRCGGESYTATSAAMENGRLTVEFGKANAKAILHVESRESYIHLAVEAASGDNIESLTFLNVPLTLKGWPDESFGSCALSLNLITRVNQLPALQTNLQASCYDKFGMEGAPCGTTSGSTAPDGRRGTIRGGDTSASSIFTLLP